jgi:hypothetical protein
VINDFTKTTIAYDVMTHNHRIDSHEYKKETGERKKKKERRNSI